MKRRVFILVILSIFLILTATSLVSCSDSGVTITYNANGGAFSNGNGTLTLEKEAGTLLVEPLPPSKKGELFVGWSTSATGGEFWDFNSNRLDVSTILYAMWRPAEAELITFTGAEINGNEVTLSVGRDIHTVIFTDKVTVSEAASWVLSYDSEGLEVINSEKATGLNLGENIYYLIVSAKDGVLSEVYTVKIIKDNTVTVTLDANAGTVTPNEATVARGECFTLPVPTRVGHVFLGWYLGNTPLTNDSGASLDGVTVTESVTLVATWRRESYTVMASVLNSVGGTVTGGGQYEYGQSVTLTAAPYLGHNFVGWFEGEDIVSADETYSFTASAGRNLVAKFDISPEMGIYEFISNETECVITGINNSVVDEIFIPAYVTEIAEGAFESATQLSAVNFLGTAAEWEEVTKADSDFLNLIISFPNQTPAGGGDGQLPGGNVDNNGWTGS